MWRCSVRNRAIGVCPATVKQCGAVFTKGVRDHIHSAKDGCATAAIIARDVKIKAKENVFRSASNIVDERVPRMLSSLEMHHISRALHLQEKLLCAVCYNIRHGSSFRKNILKREDIKEQVIQYARENVRRAQRLYVWGYASTGALGIQSYLRPDKHQRPLIIQQRPARLRYIDTHCIQGYPIKRYTIKWDPLYCKVWPRRSQPTGVVLSFANFPMDPRTLVMFSHVWIRDFDCGYGYTAFCTKWRPNKLYGSGVNTDSQIGYHEYPRNSGRILDYVIEPAKIEIPIDTPHTTKMKQVACGRAHTLLLTDDEGVFSLGNNSYGQGGRPIVDGEVYSHNPAIHKVKDLPDNIEKIICGQDHSICLTNDGQLYSCGLGADGQTGLETYDCVSKFTKIKGDIDGERIIQVHSSVDCVLALSDKGDVFGWGNSEYNQLSMVTDYTQVNVPRHLKLPACGNVKKVIAGGSICGLLNDKGEVFVWGYGILGKGPNLESTVTPEKIPETLFGKNELDPETTVTDIECGMSQFAAITDTKDLYTWGKNKKGCLGLGQNEKRDQYFPLKVAIPAEVHAVKCGVDHMVALTKAFC